MTETKHRERSNNKKKCWLTKKIPDSSLKVQSLYMKQFLLKKCHLLHMLIFKHILPHTSQLSDGVPWCARACHVVLIAISYGCHSAVFWFIVVPMWFISLSWSSYCSHCISFFVARLLLLFSMKGCPCFDIFVCFLCEWVIVCAFGDLPVHICSKLI